MADGSRHFGDLPETYDVHDPEWHRLRDHVARLDGAKLERFVTDDVIEAWIDFAYAGHRFSINNQSGNWWFFVSDPACPDEVLIAVLDHFEALLNPHAAVARRNGPVEPGTYRVVVYEPDSRVSLTNFDDLDRATTYVNDAASETENGIVSAYVLDHTLRVVAVGKHY